MQFLTPVLALFVATSAFAGEARPLPLNEVPEAVVQNLGNACNAQALANSALVLDVKSRAIDAIYAVPCQGKGEGLVYAVYVVTPKGKFSYLSFDRSNNSSTYYIPRPELSSSGDEITVAFQAATPACAAGETGLYKVADHSLPFWTSFKAERLSHDCHN